MQDRVDLRSYDLLTERIAHLREEFPETFTEGQLDFDKLKQALGEHPSLEAPSIGE